MRSTERLRRVLRDLPTGLGAKTITTVLIERVIARTYAAMALVFGALAVGPAFAGQPLMNQIWAWVFGLTIFTGFAGSAVAGIVGRRVQTTAGVVAVSYALMVMTWPLAATNIKAVQAGTPWLWGVCNVAMAAAVVAFTEWAGGIYILVVSVAWCLLRLTPPGGSAGLQRALQDAGYVFILGMAVLIAVLALRRAATAVDDWQVTATARYAEATRDLEIEKQRVNVDSLLHDTVMTTLLHVSRAETTEEKRLAARMAIKSLNVIADTEEHFDRGHAPMSAAEIERRFGQFQADLDVPVVLRTSGPTQHEIPHAVAETLFSAAMQALVNSTQHAGPSVTERSVTVKWTDSRVSVTVADDGQGFDPSVRSERLGMRVSIIERMEAVGGTVTIDTAPGEGARVTLTWVHPVAGATQAHYPLAAEVSDPFAAARNTKRTGVTMFLPRSRAGHDPQKGR